MKGLFGRLQLVSRKELKTLADFLHRQAVLAISQGASFSGTREDFELLCSRKMTKSQMPQRT